MRLAHGVLTTELWVVSEIRQADFHVLRDLLRHATEKLEEGWLSGKDAIESPQDFRQMQA